MTLQPVPSESPIPASDSPTSHHLPSANTSIPAGAPLPPTTPQSPPTGSALVQPPSPRSLPPQEDAIMIDDEPHSTPPMLCSQDEQSSPKRKIYELSNLQQSYNSFQYSCLLNDDTMSQNLLPFPDLNIGESVYELGRTLPYLNVGPSLYTGELWFQSRNGYSISHRGNSIYFFPFCNITILFLCLKLESNNPAGTFLCGKRWLSISRVNFCCLCFLLYAFLNKMECILFFTLVLLCMHLHFPPPSFIFHCVGNVFLCVLF